MALTTEDLMAREVMVRLHADRIRKDWPDDPTQAPEVQAHARFMRDEAQRWDEIANVLLGLGGCWEQLGGAEMVRDGFKRMSRSYDLSKTYVLAVEAKAAAERKAEEVAA